MPIMSSLGWTDYLNDAMGDLLFGEDSDSGYPGQFDWLSQFADAPGASPFAGPLDFGSSFPINSAAAAAEAANPLRANFGPVDWFRSLFNTSEEAAVNMAKRNEDAAVAAWNRSEVAADNALKRAREFNQNYYQDAVRSLKAAGLNPVLAAGGGIGGHSVTSPQANAPASSSSMANGINAVDLITTFAAIINSAGNLMKGISSFLPSSVISTVTSAITGNYTNMSESTNWNYNFRR